jgi:hypothetical protein
MWHRAVNKIVNKVRTSLFHKVPLPRSAGGAIANVILLRGVSHRDDPTFAKLEQKLKDNNINALRYSYTGFVGANIHQPQDYTPDDILLSDMGNFVEILDWLVQAILINQKAPLFICGYSLGGLVLANYLCRPNPPSHHHQVVSQIPVVCFLATPLFPPFPWFEIENDLFDQKTDWVHTPLGYDRAILFDRYPNDVVNVFGTRDQVAKEEYATLKIYADDPTKLGRLNEIPVGGGHARVPGHDKTITAVMAALKRHLP